MPTKKIDLDLLTSLREGFIVAWQERRFVFNLALLPVLLMGLLDALLFRSLDFNSEESLNLFIMTTTQWIISVPFVVGWILFLHGTITRKQSILDVFKKINIQWRFMWRSVAFGLILALTYGAVAGMLLFLERNFVGDSNQSRTSFLLLIPLIFIAPFFFLSMVDFVLNKKFQPLHLLKSSFGSYGKIFLTLWLLSFVFLGILSAITILLSVVFGVFQIDNFVGLQDIITASMTLSFTLSVASNMFFFWFATCAYNISYRYWRSIN